MNNKEKEILLSKTNKIIDEFWKLDCLIRIMKEILSNNNWETQEEDIFTICKILFKSSEELSSNINYFQEELNSFHL